LRRFVVLASLIVGSTMHADATVRYVRTDGASVCTGLVDAPWEKHCPSDCPCAKGTIEQGRLDLLAGDTLMIRGGGGDYDEQIVWTATYDQETTITGYGPERPVIGRITTITDSHWTLHDAATRTYRRAWDGGRIGTAYIVPYTAYENGRVGLVLYESLKWLMAAPLDPNLAYDPNNPEYYIGPGVWADTANDQLYIRLQEDTDPDPAMLGPLDDYQKAYINLGIGTDPGESEDPGTFIIKISDDYFTLRINGSHYTFDNLVIEGTVELCSDGADVHHITLSNNTIWSSRRGGVRTFTEDDPASPMGCSSEDITIRDNEILWDIPYWVSWSDVKGSPGSTGRDPAFPRAATDAIGMNDDANRWRIERNLIRGGLDGIGSSGPAPDLIDVGGHTDDIVIRYNRIEHFMDDPIEIEGEHVGRWDIYGNLIGNSLNCLSSGQQTTGFDGPVYYQSNLCALMRNPFVTRAGQTATWNGGFRYGHAQAFKMEDDDYVDGGVDPMNHLHMYNNTTLLLNSHPSKGMDFISENGKSRDMEFFNNTFIKVNGRVGQRTYPDSLVPGDLNKPRTVNWNAYHSLNPTGPLLDTYVSVSGCSNDAAGCGWETNGLGATAGLGGSPLLQRQWGWGCMDPEMTQCDGFDETAPARWAVRPGSEWWDPATLIPDVASALCNAGRHGMPGPDDPADAGYFPRNPPTPTGSAFNSGDIGAIPCGTSAAAFDYFPMNAGWSTTQLVTGHAPQVTMTSPAECPVKIEVGQSVDFCGTFDGDADGGAPMKAVWDFHGANCPADASVLCPGVRTFTGAGTCVATFYVMDRWGLFQNPPPRCAIVVKGRGKEKCDDCSRCTCDEEDSPLKPR